MSQSTACAHCGDTDEHDHDHADSFEHARTRRRQLLRLLLVRAVIVAAALLGAGLSMGFAVGVGAGLLLWAISTAVGVLTSTLLLARLGKFRALMAGALVAAALIPALAAVLSLMQPVDWWIAAGAAAGYLAGSFGAEAVRLWQLRTLLGTDTRAGEVARDSAVATRDQDHDAADVVSTAVLALLVGAYVYLTGILSAAVVVLVPLHVAIVALRRRALVRRHQSQRGAPAQRTAS